MELEGTECSLLIGLTLIVGAKSILKVGMGGGAGGAAAGAQQGMSRRAQALVANARRREAVMRCKLQALNREVEQFRKRELEATQINAGLKRRLRDALTDLDAIAMRREVRTLRADLARAKASLCLYWTTL